jgi:hypothetical protein
MGTSGQGDPREILRASQNADKISNYLLALEKERVPSNIEKLPEIPRAQPQNRRRPAGHQEPAQRPATNEDDPHR